MEWLAGFWVGSGAALRRAGWVVWARAGELVFLRLVVLAGVGWALLVLEGAGSRDGVREDLGERAAVGTGRELLQRDLVNSFSAIS